MQYMKILPFFLILLLICITNNVYSQNDKTDKTLKLLKKGDKAYSKGNYSRAVEIYKKVDSALKDDPFVDKRLGVSLCKIERYEEAVPLLQKLHKQSDTVDTYVNYYLGLSYQKLGKYEKAIAMYRPCMDHIDNERSVDKSKKEIKKRIAQCRVSKQIKTPRRDVDITRLDSAINSQFPDYGGIIHPEDSTLYFTSRRKNAEGVLSKISQANENIYSSGYKNGKWQKATKAGLNNSINTAVVGISPSGSTLYIYSDVNNGDVLSCKIKDDGPLPKPDSLPGEINTPESAESSITFSSDGQKCYFVSNRTDVQNYGGTDIFMATRGANNAWKNIKNCGPEINSKYDENFVSWSAEDTALYFSSNRKKSIGGFDIFKAKTTPDGSFAQAKNIGPPINTLQNDISFTKHGSKALYAREYKNNKEDIFEVDFGTPAPTRRYNPQWNELTITGVRKINEYKTIQPVFYETGQRNVNPENPVVDTLLKVLKSTQNAKITLSGHSDWNGNKLYNNWLSFRRAVNLADFLLKNKVDPTLLQVEAYGDNKLLTDTGFTKDPIREKVKAINRRVDITVTKQGSPYLFVEKNKLYKSLQPDSLKTSGQKFAVMTYVAPKKQNAYTFPDSIQESYSKADELYYYHTDYYNSIHKAEEKLEQLQKKYKNAYVYEKNSKKFRRKE